MTAVMRVGPMPSPTQAPPAIGFDEVTNGYVPWSTSSSVPCAPSHSTSSSRSSACAISSDVSATYGRSRGAKREHLVGGGRGVEPLEAVHVLEHVVLDVERRHDLGPQDLLVEQVLHADARARHLVGVGGADAAPRRADAQVAEPQLARAVEQAMPRHHDVRVARDPQARTRAPARLQRVELAAQHLGLDHDAVAEHAQRVLVEHARGQQPELELLLADEHGVTRVRAALVAGDDGGALRQHVDDLALPLIAPLGADDHDGGHRRIRE